jgi:hypothetical protein
MKKKIKKPKPKTNKQDREGLLRMLGVKDGNTTNRKSKTASNAINS